MGPGQGIASQAPASSAARRWPSPQTAPMIAIAGGLGAALCWAFAIVTVARASRELGAWSTLAGAMVAGLVVAVPAIAILSPPVSIGAPEVLLMTFIGVINVVGLALVYTALRGGNVSVVAPITSTEGAIAAVIAVVLGEQLAPGAGLVLGAIVVGVVLASLERTDPAVGETGDLTDDGTNGLRAKAFVHASPIRTAALALAAALTFGLNIYLVGVLGASLPAIWAALPARVVGTVAVTIPLFALGRLRMTRSALPFVVAGGVGDVAGTVSLAFGARDGIAIASVMSSQFAAFAAIAAVVLFRERLQRIQVVGIALIAVGVAVLAAVGS